MSAQPKRVMNPEVWTRWEGHVVKGIFPLRRFLGNSEQGAVFLSEYDTGKATDVAIKLVPAIPSQADAQLAYWRAAVALSHPHLVRLFDMGRCQLSGREFLFVVMEYGEQTLAQFLAQRALDPEEVRALLLPTLEALVFLHGQQLVHGRLKPSNFLIVNDQLKLSSDAIRPAGQIRSEQSGAATADDICALGMTLVEAFTQRVPASAEELDEVSSLLANVPAAFANTVRRCLHPNPANRPNVIELQEQCKSARPMDGTSEDRRHAHPLLLAMPAALLVSFLALMGQSPTEESETTPQPTNSQPAAARTPAPIPAPTPAPTRTRTPTPPPAQPIAQPEAFPVLPAMPVTDGSTPVVLEIVPDVPAAMLEKIQGRILVTVRVLVDTSGNVMGAMIENRGPNPSLAKLADEAAREWKFLPAERQSTRVWILTFEFSRFGVLARATAV